MAPYKASARLRLPLRWGAYRKAAGWPSQHGVLSEGWRQTLAWRKVKPKCKLERYPRSLVANTDHQDSHPLLLFHSDGMFRADTHEHYPNISTRPPRASPDLRTVKTQFFRPPPPVVVEIQFSRTSSRTSSRTAPAAPVPLIELAKIPLLTCTSDETNMLINEIHIKLPECLDGCLSHVQDRIRRYHPVP